MLLIFREEKKVYTLVEVDDLPESLDKRLVCKIPTGISWEDNTEDYNKSIIKAVYQALPEMDKYYQVPKKEDIDETEAIIISICEKHLELIQVMITLDETYTCFDNSTGDMIGSRKDIMDYINNYATSTIA